MLEDCIAEPRLPIAFPKPSFGIELTAATDFTASSFLGYINLLHPCFLAHVPSFRTPFSRP